MYAWLLSSAKTYRKREYGKVPFSTSRRNHRINREIHSEVVKTIVATHERNPWPSTLYSVFRAAACLPLSLLSRGLSLLPTRVQLCVAVQGSIFVCM